MAKILIYTENYARGGGNQYVIDLINYFPKNSNFILVSNTSGFFDEDLKKISRRFVYEQIKIKSIPQLIINFNKVTNNRVIGLLYKSLVYMIRFLLLGLYKNLNNKILKKKFKFHKPDLILSCNGGYPGGVTCLDCIYVAYNLKIPVILSVVSMPRKKSIVDFYYKKINEKISYLIVNAERIRKSFIIQKGFDEAKVAVLHNFVSSSQILKEEFEFNNYSKSKKLYKLGYIGRVEQLKGIFILLSAFERLKAMYPNLQLIIIGAGKDLDRAKKYCTERKIENSVRFTGYYPGDVKEIFRSVDLFVFPSLWEGLPYVILEAMANATLVVTTNVGGIPEVIIDNYNGYLVNAGDSKELINKITLALTNKNNTQIVLNALKTIKEKFSDVLFSKKLESLVNKSISEIQFDNK